MFRFPLSASILGASWGLAPFVPVVGVRVVGECLH